MSTVEQQNPAEPGDAEFVNIVNELATSLSNNQHSDIQQQTFFRLSDLPRKRLPKGSNASIAENFLAVTISIISMKESSLFALKAIKVLHTYLRYDGSIFQIFRPNKPLLRKMNLEAHIMSSNPSEVEAALGLAQFLLRYHRAVDYGDFSENPYAVQRIRRFCDYKVWFEIEELSGSHEDLSGNFSEFKTVTQKALQEIVAHLERISSESENKINFSAKSLSKRVNDDIAALNDQIAGYKTDKEGLQSENYKKLLDLLMQLDNKMKQTNQSMIGDLRQEFVTMLNARDQGREDKLRDANDRLYGKIGALEGKMGSTDELDELRKEFEKIVHDRALRQETLYTKVLDVLSELEKKQDGKFSGLIGDLRRQIDEQLNGRAIALEKGNSAQNQKVLEMLQQLENRLDSRNVEIVRDMMAEIDNQESKTAKMIDSSNERVLNLINQLNEQLGAKNSELSDQVNNLSREFQKLINERSRQLEAVAQANHQRLLELIVDLEKRLAKTVQEQLADQAKNTERALQEGHDSNQRDLKSLNDRVVQNMVELEKRIGQRQTDMNVEFKRDFQAILDEKIARVEGLTNENYKRTLQLLLELEKRMDTRQSDLLSELRNDFAKVVSQLDSSQMMRELEESFGRKIKTVEQALVDQERNLSNTFDGLIRQADQQIQKTVQEVIRQNEQELERQVDDKIADVSGKVRRSIDLEIKKAKDNLSLQIEQAIDLQQRGMQGMIKNSIDESKSGFERQVDKVIREMNGKMIEVIDQRMEDSQGSIGRIVDTKIAGALQRQEEDIGSRMKDSLSALWSKTEKELANLDQVTKKNLDGKVDINTLQNRLNEDMQNQTTNILLQVNEQHAELQRAYKRDIEKATHGLTDKSGDIDDVAKAMIDRLRQRMEQIEASLEDERRSTNTKLKETKNIIESNTENRINELRRLFEKLLHDSQQQLDQQFRVIIKENLDESRRGIDKDMEIKMDSKLASSFAKYSASMEVLNNKQSVAESAKLWAQFQESMKRLETKNGEALNDTVKQLLDDWNQKLNQINDNMRKLREMIMTSVDEKIADMQSQGGGSSAEMQIAFKGLVERQDLQLATYDKQIGQLQGKVNAYDQELDSMMEIKVSNQIRTLKQSINERLQKVNDEYAEQTNRQTGELKDRINQFDVTMHALQLNSDQYGHKIQAIETTLSEQVDIVQNLNDRISQQVETQKGQIGGIDKRTQQLEAKFIEIVNNVSSKAGTQKQIEELQQIIALLQSNDTQQGIDIKFLKERVQTELEAKLALILRNRDDLLKRVEDAEQQMERSNGEASQRISRAEQRLEDNTRQSNERVVQLANQVQDLSNDVHSQIDRAIRDLETSDLKLQKEINDLNDNQKRQTAQVAEFKDWVGIELKTEFEKINKNFIHSAGVLDSKEKRLQAEIERLKAQLAGSVESLKSVLSQRGQDANSASSSELSALKGAIKQQSEMLIHQSTEIEKMSNDWKSVKLMLARFTDLEQKILEMEKRIQFFMQFIEEQAIDKVKLVMSNNDNTLEAKLESVEWHARYMKYINPGTIKTMIGRFKGIFYTAKAGSERVSMAQLSGHSTTGIETITVNLRDQKRRVDITGTQKLEVASYDLQNCLQCGLLECLLINNQNVEQFIKCGGIADVSRLFSEQPLPSEFDDGSFNYADDFINSSFKPAIRCIMQAMRSERAVVEFMANRTWFERLLQISEEYGDEEVIIATSRTMKLIFKSNAAMDIIEDQYPSMGDFLGAQMTNYADSYAIVSESILALDLLLNRPYYIKQMGGHWYPKIAGMKNNPKNQGSAATFNSVLAKLVQK